MKLREKLCEPLGGLSNNTANELEKIADEYAVDFAKWFVDSAGKPKGDWSANELLQIFKKEKGM